MKSACFVSLEFIQIHKKKRASGSSKYEYDIVLMIDMELSFDLAESILRTCSFDHTICHFW